MALSRRRARDDRFDADGTAVDNTKKRRTKRHDDNGLTTRTASLTGLDSLCFNLAELTVKQGRDAFHRVGPDIIRQVISYLSLCSAARIAETTTQLRRMVNAHPTIWKRVLIPPLPPSLEPFESSTLTRQRSNRFFGSSFGGNNNGFGRSGGGNSGWDSPLDNHNNPGHGHGHDGHSNHDDEVNPFSHTSSGGMMNWSNRSDSGSIFPTSSGSFSSASGSFANYNQPSSSPPASSSSSVAPPQNPFVLVNFPVDSSMIDSHRKWTIAIHVALRRFAHPPPGVFVTTPQRPPPPLQCGFCYCPLTNQQAHMYFMSACTDCVNTFLWDQDEVITKFKFSTKARDMLPHILVRSLSSSVTSGDSDLNTSGGSDSSSSNGNGKATTPLSSPRVSPSILAASQSPAVSSRGSPVPQSLDPVAASPSNSSTSSNNQDSNPTSESLANEPGTRFYSAWDIQAFKIKVAERARRGLSILSSASPPTASSVPSSSNTIVSLSTPSTLSSSSSSSANGPRLQPSTQTLLTPATLPAFTSLAAYNAASAASTTNGTSLSPIVVNTGADSPLPFGDLSITSNPFNLITRGRPVVITPTPSSPAVGTPGTTRNLKRFRDTSSSSSTSTTTTTRAASPSVTTLQTINERTSAGGSPPRLTPSTTTSNVVRPTAIMARRSAASASRTTPSSLSKDDKFGSGDGESKDERRYGKENTPPTVSGSLTSFLSISVTAPTPPANGSTTLENDDGDAYVEDRSKRRRPASTPVATAISDTNNSNTSAGSFAWPHHIGVVAQLSPNHATTPTSSGPSFGSFGPSFAASTNVTPWHTQPTTTTPASSAASFSSFSSLSSNNHSMTSLSSLSSGTSSGGLASLTVPLTSLPSAASPLRPGMTSLQSLPSSAAPVGGLPSLTMLSPLRNTGTATAASSKTLGSVARPLFPTHTN